MRRLINSRYLCQCGKRYDHVEVFFTPNSTTWSPSFVTVSSSVRVDLRYRCKWCMFDYKSDGLIRSNVL